MRGDIGFTTSNTKSWHASLVFASYLPPLVMLLNTTRMPRNGIRSKPANWACRLRHTDVRGPVGASGAAGFPERGRSGATATDEVARAERVLESAAAASALTVALLAAPHQRAPTSGSGGFSRLSSRATGVGLEYGGCNCATSVLRCPRARAPRREFREMRQRDACPRWHRTERRLDRRAAPDRRLVHRTPFRTQ